MKEWPILSALILTLVTLFLFIKCDRASLIQKSVRKHRAVKSQLSEWCGRSVLHSETDLGSAQEHPLLDLPDDTIAWRILCQYPLCVLFVCPWWHAKALAEYYQGTKLAGTLRYARGYMWCKVVSKIGKVLAPRSSVCEIKSGEVSLLSEINICPVENLNTTRTDTLGVLRSILARWSLFAACCCVYMWMAEWEQTPQIQNTLDS